MLIFDEASAIADKVWEVAEGALTDEGTEIIWLIGEPTQNIGTLPGMLRRYRNRVNAADRQPHRRGTNRAYLGRTGLPRTARTATSPGSGCVWIYQQAAEQFISWQTVEDAQQRPGPLTKARR